MLSRSTNDVALPHPLASGHSMLDGTPSSAFLPLDNLGGTEIGIWEMTPGTAADVEVDEILAITSGLGTLSVNGRPPMLLTPGTIVRLHAGDRSVWAIDEPLRAISISTEVIFAAPDSSPQDHLAEPALAR